MQDLLAQTTAMLQGAIKDVFLGAGSDFGYSAIFKDSANVPYIKAVLQKMVDGSPMPVRPIRSLGVGLPSSFAPTLMMKIQPCANFMTNARVRWLRLCSFRTLHGWFCVHRSLR